MNSSWMGGIPNPADSAGNCNCTVFISLKGLVAAVLLEIKLLFSFDE
jgi:hypothetical protein